MRISDWSSDVCSSDLEDLDLLRVVGQQLASYLAEQAVQRALMEASRFDEFSRRIAFVIHDIKNLASQLSMLARNAEKHADKRSYARRVGKECVIHGRSRWRPCH